MRLTYFFTSTAMSCSDSSAKYSQWRRAVCPEQFAKSVLVVPPTQKRTGRLKGGGKEKRGTITSPRCLCVTEPKPLILRKRFHPTPTSKKRKIILVEYKKEKFRLISALQALRVRRRVILRKAASQANRFVNQ